MSLALARLALELGPLFPLQRRRKDPLPGSHGCLDAVDDLDQVERWLRRGLNLGLHTVRVFVLDVDLRSGGDRTLADLEARHGKLPDTPRQFTGGGGGAQHFFALPEGVRWRANLGRTSGIDIKAGPGCYVLVPPSVVARSYTWDESPEHCELAELPAWLLERAARFDAAADVTPTGPVGASVLGLALLRTGAVLFQRDGKLAVRCPWAASHTSRPRHQDSSTVVFPPSTSRPLGSFFCSHAHCDRRTAEEVLAELDPAIVAWAVAAAHEAREEAATRCDLEERAAIQWEGRGCPEERAA